MGGFTQVRDREQSARGRMDLEQIRECGTTNLLGTLDLQNENCCIIGKVSPDTVSSGKGLGDPPYATRR